MQLDRNNRYLNRPVELQRHDNFGQVRRFFVVHLKIPALVVEPQTFLLTLIAPCKVDEERVGRGSLVYSVTRGDFQPEVVVDVHAINFLAGRVADVDRGRFWFVEKPGAQDWMNGTGIDWEDEIERG